MHPEGNITSVSCAEQENALESCMFQNTEQDITRRCHVVRLGGMSMLFLKRMSQGERGAKNVSIRELDYGISTVFV